MPASDPPPPAGQRQTFVLTPQRMTSGIPVTFPEGHEVASVLSWKPARGPDEWDVTFLVQVTG